MKSASPRYPHHPLSHFSTVYHKSYFKSFWKFANQKFLESFIYLVSSSGDSGGAALLHDKSPGCGAKRELAGCRAALHGALTMHTGEGGKGRGKLPSQAGMPPIARHLVREIWKDTMMHSPEHNCTTVLTICLMNVLNVKL